MVNIKVDNFEYASSIINVENPDDEFFYVDIMKRKKDNFDKQPKNIFGSFAKKTAFKVHSGEELLSLKDDIIKKCEENNARCYICLNPSSESILASLLKTTPRLTSTGAEVFLYDGISTVKPGYRVRFDVDVDSKDQSKWEAARKKLIDNVVEIETEYITVH